MLVLFILFFRWSESSDSSHCSSLEERLRLLEFATEQAESVQSSVPNEKTTSPLFLSNLISNGFFFETLIQSLQRENMALKAQLAISDKTIGHYAECNPEVNVYVQKGRLVTTIPILYSGWIVQFDIKPFGITADYGNILHMTTGRSSCCDHGTRIPAVWLVKSSTQLLIQGFRTNINRY